MVLSIEDGWRKLADGLHIHRYFLHVKPYKQRRIRELWKRRQENYVGRGNTSLETLCRNFSLGLVEHLLLQDLDLSKLLQEAEETPCVVSMASKRVALLRIDDCHPTKELPAIINGHCLTASSPAFSTSLIADLSDLLETSELSFLFQLGVDAIVVSPADAPYIFRNEVCLNKELPGTVHLCESSSPLQMAEDLLASAAIQWFNCFLQCSEGKSYSSQDWLSPWTGTRVTTYSIAVDIFQKSVRLRFLQNAIGMPQIATRSEALKMCKLRAERESQNLIEVRDIVYKIADALNDISMYDLLTTFYPGPRQFEKYYEGGGAGQAE